MNKFSNTNMTDNYKPGGINHKIHHYHSILNDRARLISEAENNLDPNNPDPKIEKYIQDTRENFNHWKSQYYKFTEEPNNDPDVIKTILDSLIELSKHEVPTQLYMYLSELKKITITNEDINYLIDIFSAQKDTFESTYFDDVAENVDEANSRAEAETEMFSPPINNFDEQLNRKVSKNYQKIVKLANYYDQTKQYKKADHITNTLMRYIGK